MQLVAEVNEEDIPKVRKDHKALIRSDAFPGEMLTATVASITPKGDPVLKNYRVYLELPRDTPLRIGMTTEINIVTTEKEDALLLPLAAFDGSVLQILGDDDRLSLVRVKTGIRGTRTVEVLDGVDAQDRVVFPFREDLSEGDRISPEDVGAR
ncbi:MAG: HlyD family efflux transporter periplasmic adaptor subunit [Pseudomonadota bacterium]